MTGEVREVTGLVLHFRTPRQTVACLNSLLANGVARAVLVDNSEDEGQSVRTMRPALAELRDAGLVVEVMSEGRNLGFARGVALGLRGVAEYAPGDVLLINSDASLEPSALSAMRDLVPHAEIVVPWLCSGDTEGPRSPVSHYQKMFALILRRAWVGTSRYASGCCMLVRQDVAKPGLFDEEFFFYGEDTMLGFRMDREGWKLRECDAAIVRHAGSGSAKNGSLFYEYHMNRAHWLLANKLACSRLERSAFYLARFLVLPLRATLRSLRAKSLVPWRALMNASYDAFHGRCKPLTPPMAAGGDHEA